MKRIFFTIIFSALVTTASSADFVCNGIGLRVTDGKALYGNRELIRCGKAGLMVLFAETCDEKSATKFSLGFDEISNNILTLINGKESQIRCLPK
jgi:hypothetical protein